VRAAEKAEKVATKNAAAKKAAAEKAANAASEKVAAEKEAARKAVAAVKVVAKTFKCKRCIEVSLVRDELNEHIASKHGINSPKSADLKQLESSCQLCSGMIYTGKCLKNHTCDYTGTVPSTIDHEPWRWAGHRRCSASWGFPRVSLASSSSYTCRMGEYIFDIYIRLFQTFEKRQHRINKG
jgi:hypothetical protein